MTAVAIADAPQAEVPQSRRETALRLGALLVGTAAVTALIAIVGGWPWIVVVYTVIAIIMLHEFGHYVTARLCGMKATEFFVGFGPKLWSVRRGETEYGVKALPLGGYVRILGMTSMEELEPSDEPRSFINHTTRQRVLVASAGSIVHVLLALVLAFCALFFIGRPGPVHFHSGVQIEGLVTVKGAVTPAERAGLKTGEYLLGIDGHAVTIQNVAKLVGSGGGTAALSLLLQDGTRRFTVSATPRKVETSDPHPVLGVYLAQVGTQPLLHPGVVGSVTGSGSFVWLVTRDTVSAFGNAFSFSGLSSLFHDVTNSKAGQAAAQNPNQPRSIVGASEILVDAARRGMLPFLEVLISLNISLGVLNMLPMLPLDGGHVAIALYERIRTRRGRSRYRADVNKLVPYAYAFMALLLVFVASKAYLDVAHGVTNPFG